MRLDSWIVKVENGYGEVMHHSTPMMFDDASKVYYDRIKQFDTIPSREKNIHHTGMYESKFIIHMLKTYQNPDFVFNWFVRNVWFQSHFDKIQVSLMHESIS